MNGPAKGAAADAAARPQGSAAVDAAARPQGSAAGGDGAAGSPPDETAARNERSIWTAAIVIGASLPHWLSIPPWVPALLVVCVVWRLGALMRGLPLPGSPLRLLLAFIAFSAVLLEYRTINGIEPGSALLIVMVALKVLESHTQRDQLVLMIIAYFLVFTSLLEPGGLLSGAYLLAFVWITTAGLLQLGRSGPLLRGRPTAKLAGRLLLQAVPIMLVLFVLFPRLPGPLWAVPNDARSGTTGLSESMSPGDITNLGLSDEVALRVRFLSAPPAPEEMYWRGPVLSKFDGRTWTRDGGMRRPVFDALEHMGAPVEYRVMLEPIGMRGLLALDMPRRWSGQRDIRMGGDYQLRQFPPAPTDARIDYSATSYTSYRARERLTEAEREHYRALPEGSNPRTREMVAGWLAEGAAPRDVIARALELFRDEPFFYTLTPPALGTHSVDEFIFDTREGFCEHYASAFAIMLRAAGQPARVVTGYQGGELNELAEWYVVRQSDAHAWTEVWLESEGWVRVDPVAAVAPQRIELGAARGGLGGDAGGRTGFGGFGWLRTAALAWDTVHIYWQDWVLGYGPRLQRSLLEALGFERPHWTQLLGLAAIATGAVLAGVMGWLAWRFRRLRRVDPAARHFERFVNRLARANVPAPRPAEGPAAYAARARRAVPGAAREIDAILRAYLGARYEPDPHGRRLALLADLVRRFRVRRRGGRYRRLPRGA